MFQDRDLFFNREGVPISVKEFGRLHRDFSYVRVARTTVMDAANPTKVLEISTVWLGINHNYFEYGPPLIFETMVFGEGSSVDEAMDRYATLKEAEEGHRSMVVTVAATLEDPVVMETAER